MKAVILDFLKENISNTSKDIENQQKIKKISQEYIDKSNHFKAQELNRSRKEKEYQLSQERIREKS